MATLVVLQDGKPVPYSLSNPETILGRNPQCEIHLPSNMVSRQHAKIIKEGDAYFFEDCGSGNGSFVRLHGRIPLHHEDTLRVGQFQMKFMAESEAEKNAAAPRPIRPTGYTPSDTAPEMPHMPAAAGRFDPEAPEQFNAEGDDQNATVNLEISDEGEGADVLKMIGAGDGYGLLDVKPEEKLRGILDISKALAGTLDAKAILPKVLDTLLKLFPGADRGSIVLKDPKSDRMIPAAQKHRREDEDETVRLSRTILKQVMESKSAILSADASEDDRFAAQSIEDFNIRSMMCAPLVDHQGVSFGVINLDTQSIMSTFTEDDLELLVAVAGQSALSLESARLLESFMQKQKQDNEMEIARDVQRALLPVDLPVAEGWEFFASYDSAQAVGGDYFDAFPLGEDKICLSFGDVAGKGVPGALIMSRMSAVVEATMAFTQDVEEAMTAINNRMCGRAVEGRFVTYVLVVIDLKTNKMTLCNGGHMSPLTRRVDGEVDEFDDETIGVPVGVLDDYPFEVVERVIEPGETVVLITDGVDEAMNHNSDLYTKERVKAFISSHGPKADELGKALLEDVRKHADGRPQNDDITIMTFGRNA